MDSYITKSRDVSDSKAWFRGMQEAITEVMKGYAYVRLPEREESASENRRLIRLLSLRTGQNDLINKMQYLYCQESATESPTTDINNRQLCERLFISVERLSELMVSVLHRDDINQAVRQIKQLMRESKLMEHMRSKAIAGTANLLWALSPWLSLLDDDENWFEPYVYNDAIKNKYMYNCHSDHYVFRIFMSTLDKINDRHILQTEILNFTTYISYFRVEYGALQVRAGLSVIRIGQQHVNHIGSFDSTREAFFQFDFSTKDTSRWDPQVYKIQPETKYDALLDLQVCREARPASLAAARATAIYLYGLRSVQEEAYRYLLQCGFMSQALDIHSYHKECKRFTIFLKDNYSAISQLYKIEPRYLFELENLSGYLTEDRDIDWKTQISDWISLKNSCTCAVSAILAAKLFKADEHQMIDCDFSGRASNFYSDGSAKGQKLLLLNEKLRLTKQEADMLKTWKQRNELIFSKKIKYGFPIVKKELTKIRYIINTDEDSHYNQTPLAVLLERLAPKDKVYPLMGAEQKSELFRHMHQPILKVAADQSSFDHNVSKDLLVMIVSAALRIARANIIRGGKTIAAIQQTIRDLAARRSFIIGDRVERWSSGVLSGWRCTAIYDSLANIIQMQTVSEYSLSNLDRVVVQGDDVMMTFYGDQVDTVKFFKSMNAVGLVQHPSKTMVSKTHVEFVRFLHNCKASEMSAYPARMVSSILFTKPWMSPNPDTDEVANQTASRITNWQRLSRRFNGSNLVYQAFVNVDLQKRYQRRMIMPGSEQMSIEMRHKPDRSLQKYSALAPLDISDVDFANARVSDLLLQHKKADIFSGEGRLTIVQIAAYHEGSQIVLTKPAKHQVIVWPPIPKSLVSQIVNRVGKKEAVLRCYQFDYEFQIDADERYGKISPYIDYLLAYEQAMSHIAKLDPVFGRKQYHTLPQVLQSVRTMFIGSIDVIKESLDEDLIRRYKEFQGRFNLQESARMLSNLLILND